MTMLRIKLLLNYIKTATLFVIWYLWMFSPAFLILLLPESAIILGWICIIAVFFNIKLSSGDNFIVHKWSKKLETEQNELRYAIYEAKGLIKEVGGIKILPFRKK